MVNIIKQLAYLLALLNFLSFSSEDSLFLSFLLRGWHLWHVSPDGGGGLLLQKVKK